MAFAQNDRDERQPRPVRMNKRWSFPNRSLVWKLCPPLVCPFRTHLRIHQCAMMASTTPTSWPLAYTLTSAHMLSSCSLSPSQALASPESRQWSNKWKSTTKTGFRWKELHTYRMTVYRNLVDSVQAIALAMRKIGVDCETPSNHVSLSISLSFFVSIWRWLY